MIGILGGRALQNIIRYEQKLVKLLDFEGLTFLKFILLVKQLLDIV